MNMYIVVEGKHTEINVYPAWLAFVAPKMTRIDNPRNVCSNNYYLISGEGIPSIYNGPRGIVRGGRMPLPNQRR